MGLPAKRAPTIYIREDLAGDKSGSPSPGGAAVPAALTCLPAVGAKPVSPRAALGTSYTFGVPWERQRLMVVRSNGRFGLA